MSMNLDSVDLTKLTERQLMKINAKLPKPKQKILGHTYVLPITIAMGCQISILDYKDLRGWLAHRPCFLLDGNKKISFPGLTPNEGDSTYDYLNIGGDYFCVGTGSLGRKYSNHIDALYSPDFFGFNEKNLLNVPIESRHGWCCTMSKNRDFRNLITDIIQSHYIDRFDNATWFCYDGINHTNQKMIDLMFRKPGSNDIQMIEYVDGLEYLRTKDWHNLRFVDGYDLKRYGNKEQPWQGTKNSAGNNVGYMLGPWHKSCLIELVAETRYDIFFATEKVVKPIRAGMPFVVVSSHKFLYRLRRMGFQTFHPYIDESYDLETNWKKRTKMAIDSMYKFLSYPNNIDKIEKICKHNQDIIIKIGKHDPVRRIAKKLRSFISF